MSPSERPKPHSHFACQFDPDLCGAIGTSALVLFARSIGDELKCFGLDIQRIQSFDRGFRIELKGEFAPLRIECLPPGEYLEEYVCQVLPVGPTAWRRLRRVRISKLRARLISLLESALEVHPAISQLTSWHHGCDRIKL